MGLRVGGGGGPATEAGNGPLRARRLEQARSNSNAWERRFDGCMPGRLQAPLYRNGGGAVRGFGETIAAFFGNKSFFPYFLSVLLLIEYFRFIGFLLNSYILFRTS